MSFHDELDGRQRCRGADLELFFPNTSGRHGAARAKELCRSCPFRTPCRTYALAHNIAGVWGGLTQRERRAMQRERGITPIPVQIPTGLIPKQQPKQTPAPPAGGPPRARPARHPGRALTPSLADDPGVGKTSGRDVNRPRLMQCPRPTPDPKA